MERLNFIASFQAEFWGHKGEVIGTLIPAPFLCFTCWAENYGAQLYLKIYKYLPGTHYTLALCWGLCVGTPVALAPVQGDKLLPVSI